MANENGRKAAILEYMDYSTIHGIGRTKNTPYMFFKIFWLLAILASLGMITWQVYGLYLKYESHPISTSVEVKSAKKLQFPSVTICNTNPAQYSRIESGSALDEVIQAASKEYSVDLDIFNSSDIYSYNYTSYDKKYKDVTISNDIMWKTSAQFRMQMAILDLPRLVNITQSFEDFFLLCTFAGEECDSNAILTKRTYNYGLCYQFQPKFVPILEPHGKVAVAGPKYALEVLLNVDQSEGIPFVTSSAGVVVMTDSESAYFHENHGVFVPTGFETNIALSSVSKKRVPGKRGNLRCVDQSPDQMSLLRAKRVPVSLNCNGREGAWAFTKTKDCYKTCKLKDIRERCGCYLYFFETGLINGSVALNETFDTYTGTAPCYTDDHYECIKRVEADYTREPAERCAQCLPTCIENFYERDVSMATWPNENFLPILRRIMQSRMPDVDLNRINRDYFRGNLALVRIYLSSLSYQYIKEEYAYSEVDFISDIGGQLGLWAGFSVLSLLEVIELILLMCASGRKAQKTKPENGEI